MAPTRDLSGCRFGKLVALKKGEPKIQKNGTKTTTWICRCDCGNIKITQASTLISGNARSCGCSHIKHGKSDTRLYNTWTNIKQRCYNPKNTYYYNYGGRGIQMCDEWRNSYEKFEEWALNNGYNDTLSIDRIDNDDDYTPQNCRWATKLQQDNNKRSNVFITYNGETHTMMEWSEILGVPYSLIQSRHMYGWDDKSITETPRNKHHKRKGDD